MGKGERLSGRHGICYKSAASIWAGDRIEWLYVNQAFGMLCAYGHAQSIFMAQPFDERRRLLQSLQAMRLPCLDPVIAEGNTTGGNFKSNWNVALSAGETSMLDALVTAFNLLAGTAA